MKQWHVCEHHQSKSTCFYYITYSHEQCTIPVLTKSKGPKRKLYKLEIVLAESEIELKLMNVDSSVDY